MYMKQERLKTFKLMVCGEDIAESVINITFLLKKIMLNITDISTKKKLFFMYVNILSKDTDSHMK